MVHPTGSWSTPLAQGNVGRVSLMADALSIDPGATILCRSHSARRGGLFADTLLVLRIERRIPIKPGESFSYTGPAHVYADRTLSAAGQTPLKITGRWLLVHRHPTDVAVPKGSFSSTACAAPRRSFTAYRGAPLRP